jgi:hypothetical protein
MALLCPRCTRQVVQPANPAEPPLFCVYCGQKLRNSSTEDTAPRIVQPSPVAALLSFDPDLPANGEAGQQITRSLNADPSEADPPRPQDTAPSHVGGYRLVRFIGAGGMGNVYEAEVPATGEKVAVKLLNRRLTANPASVERFRQEGRLASQISHPRCVFVLRADADNGRPFIVMELMPGKTLKDLVDDRGPLPVRDAIAHMLDVIDGLIEAHRLGVIHRDVKPSNCFLTDDGRVKVGDFGLSKSLAGSTPDKQLTHSGTFLGTVLFAPPEQIRHEPVGYDSDVYAVSATLYFLLAGQAPHQHESLTAVLAKAISEPAPPLRPKRPDVSAELERIILRGLERDRTRRFASLEELRDALLDQLPALQQPAAPRVMAVAYLIDCLALFLVAIPFDLWYQWAADAAPRVGVQVGEVSLINTAITVAYFALAEGLFGTTLGKRLLRLKVVRLGETGPPGLGRAAVRTLAYNAVWVLMLGLPALAPVLGGAAVGALGVLGFVAGLGLLLLQVRRTEHGYRGVHDFAAGTRTVRRATPGRRTRLVSKYPNPLDRVMRSVVPLPETVGGFVVTGKVCEIDDGGEVWTAEDKSLGRRIVVRVEPPGVGDDSQFDEPVVRPSRLRAVGHGTVEWGGGTRAWEAFVAPAGSPLPDVTSPTHPLPWASARTVLEQLVGELIDGRTDGTVPRVLTVEQVWVEPGGRAQLLDFPLPTGQAVAAGETKSRYPGGAFDPTRFVKQVAALALEGVARNGRETVHAPLPPPAARIVNTLFADRYADLTDLQADLKENHAHPAEVNTGMRAGHLTVQAVLLALGVFVTLVGGLYQLIYAVNVIQGARVPEVVAGWVESDAGREQILAAVAAHYPPDHPQRENVEVALSDAFRAETVRLLRERADVRKREVDRTRDRLNRPERMAVGWLESALESRSDFAEAPVSALGLVTSQLMLVRYDRDVRTATAEPEFLLRAHLLQVIAFPLLLWPVFAVLFRGGLAYWFAGVTLVWRSGRRVGRLWCGLRELLVWVPFTVAALGSLLAQYYLPDWVMVRTFLWLLAVVLLPLMVTFALRDPARGPHDKLLGTYLVPA